MQPDNLLNARYRVIYAVDERPSGATLRARDEQSGALVLLSIIPIGEADSNDVTLLARQISTVQHELLLPLTDHFTDSGRYILVCPDPGGQDLERMLRARGGPQSEQETLAQATKLLELVDLLHQQKPSLHIGDLWPSDLLLDQGNWRLTPFPLVRMVSPTPSPYRAPELAQTSFEPAATTDTYAVAALLYYALSGTPPSTPEQQHAGTPLIAPRTLNPALSPLVEQTLLRGLQLKTANRYQNARELRLALETVHLMAGRSLGLGPDILKSPEIIAATSAVTPATGATQVLPVDVPLLPAAPIAVPPEAAQSQYVYEPLPAPAAPPRKGLSTGCLIGLALGLAAVVLAIAIALVLALSFNGAFASLFGRSAPLGTSRAATVPSGANAITVANVATITQTATITSEMFGPIAYAPPDGSTVAIGVGSVIRLTGADLREQRQLAGHSGAVIAVAFSPDGTLLASAAQGDTSARIWDVASGKLRQTLKGHTDWLRSVAFSPDGKLLATGSLDLDVKLWNVADGRLVSTMKGHTGWIGSVAFAPDGKTLAASSRDGTVLIWNVADGTLQTGFFYKNQIDPRANKPYFATALVYTPDGKQLAVGAFDGSIALIDTTSGKLVRRLTGHEDFIVLRGLAVAPDGSTLYSTGADGTVRAWNIATGSEIGQFTGGQTLLVLGLALSPDGTRLASISAEEGNVIVWDTASRTQVDKLLTEQGLITGLAFTPDGSALGMTSVGGALRLRQSDGKQSVVGAPGSVKLVAFLANAQLGILTDQGEVRIVRPRDNTNQVLNGLDGTPLALVANRTGTLLASGSSTGKIAVWDAEGKSRAVLQSQIPVAQLLAISDDGRYLAVGGTPQLSQVEVWEIGSAKLIQSLAGPREGVNTLTFAPASTKLAATDRAGELFLWDIPTAKLISLKQASTAQVRYSALAFSPDGTLLIGGALNGELIAWNGADGSEINTVPIATDMILTLAFSPDGQQIAASVRDEQASVFMLGAKS